jgi:hypothetical protein
MQGSRCEAASATVYRWWATTRSDSACIDRLLGSSRPGHTKGAADKQVASLSVMAEHARVPMDGCYQSTLCTHRPPSNGACGSTRM